MSHDTGAAETGAEVPHEIADDGMQAELTLRVCNAEGKKMDWKLEIARNGNDTVVVVRGAREPYNGAGTSDAPTESDLYTVAINNSDEHDALAEALKQVKDRMRADGYSDVK